jgi:hypothetical protein
MRTGEHDRATANLPGKGGMPGRRFNGALGVHGERESQRLGASKVLGVLAAVKVRELATITFAH